MPVTTPHPQFEAQAKLWQTVLDCIEGPAAIQAGREIYLPKLRDQDEETYADYLGRGEFFNVTSLTHQAVVGALFRKKPTLETKIDEFTLDNVDLQGTSFDDYAARVAGASSSIGRAGTLIDWSQSERRPYLSFYPGQAIRNWMTIVQDGKVQLTLLVLRECLRQQTDPNDPFLITEVVNYRVYTTTPDGVRVDKWQAASAAGSDFTIIETTYPARRGEPLREIPFIFHGSENTDPELGPIPLYDIAHINVQHFKNSCDIERGCHIAGNPTPWVSGHEPDGKLYMGCDYAWVFPEASASAGFLEFTGQGLSSIKERMEEKQHHMAAMGARMIEPRKGDAEAYSTVALRNTAETSALAKLSVCVSTSLTRALRWIEWWGGTLATVQDAETIYTLHRDFMATEIDPTKLTALMAAWQQNAISYETLFHALQRGEVIPEDRTLEEEKDMIEANPPMPAPRAIPGGLDKDGKPIAADKQDEEQGRDA